MKLLIYLSGWSMKTKLLTKRADDIAKMNCYNNYYKGLPLLSENLLWDEISKTVKRKKKDE